MSSIYTTKTEVSSILKSYTACNREKAKQSAINKVRFALPEDRGLKFAIENVINFQNYLHYNEFVLYLNESNINDDELLRIIKESRQVVHLLKPVFVTLVEAILSINWTKKNELIVQEYSEFVIDLLVAHNKYSDFVIKNLISKWVPDMKKNPEEWIDAIPTGSTYTEMNTMHILLKQILNAVPLTFQIVAEKIEDIFPYFKQPCDVVAGYIHNVLWLLQYQPNFLTIVTSILFKRLLILDVNAPQDKIEEAELNESRKETCDETIFQLEINHENTINQERMNHSIAETLDVCMVKMLNFSDQVNKIETESLKSITIVNLKNYFEVILQVFDNFILPTHNTHHIQFLLFHYCSFKPHLAKKFLTSLWNKVNNPNISAPIRQAAIGYIASFLARAKFIPILLIKQYLRELANWAHNYVERCDSVRSNSSLKANIVFFSVCQAIFYVIAFRSRDLTIDKNSLQFLQSLHLSALVTSNFNPLRVCLPAIATAFAGVTRAYQLAYCHTILERNARRKLATVYANDVVSREDCLETFFPFDRYLLKRSGKSINNLYLHYHANEAEEEALPIETYSNQANKRSDTEMMGDDIDDFISEKKFKFCDAYKNHDKDNQFTYGLSPGFHL